MAVQLGVCWRRRTTPVRRPHRRRTGTWVQGDGRICAGMTTSITPIPNSRPLAVRLPSNALPLRATDESQVLLLASASFATVCRGAGDDELERRVRGSSLPRCLSG